MTSPVEPFFGGPISPSFLEPLWNSTCFGIFPVKPIDFRPFIGGPIYFTPFITIVGTQVKKKRLLSAQKQHRDASIFVEVQIAAIWPVLQGTGTVTILKGFPSTRSQGRLRKNIKSMEILPEVDVMISSSLILLV